MQQRMLEFPKMIGTDPKTGAVVIAQDAEGEMSLREKFGWVTTTTSMAALSAAPAAAVPTAAAPAAAPQVDPRDATIAELNAKLTSQAAEIAAIQAALAPPKAS
jgi:hypothetical protein